MSGPAAELRADGSIWLDPLAAERIATILSRQWRARAELQGGFPRWQLEVLKALNERVRWADVLEGQGLPFAEPSNTSSGKMEVSADEAAEVFGCSPRWVRDRARKGAIPARRVGGRWLIELHREDIAA